VEQGGADLEAEPQGHWRLLGFGCDAGLGEEGGEFSVSEEEISQGLAVGVGFEEVSTKGFDAEPGDVYGDPGAGVAVRQAEASFDAVGLCVMGV
jgi:hypothetical protein